MNKHNMIQASHCDILQTVSIKVYSVNPFSRKPYHTDSSQLIWNASKSLHESNQKVFPNKLY